MEFCCFLEDMAGLVWMNSADSVLSGKRSDEGNGIYAVGALISGWGHRLRGKPLAPRGEDFE